MSELVPCVSEPFESAGVWALASSCGGLEFEGVILNQESPKAFHDLWPAIVEVYLLIWVDAEVEEFGALRVSAVVNQLVAAVENGMKVITADLWEP